jgi:uncharacterized damage-inducible protein DinB
MTTMLDHLTDLVAHMAWADAAHWRAVVAHDTACDDRTLRERLHHIHLVQHYFHSVVADGPFTMTRPADFLTLESLRQYGRDGLEALRFVTGTLDPATADSARPIPWFTDPPLELTVSQALVQAAMHSQHHRGQNAVRLREIGAEPPATDMIVWWWKGRPAPHWD